eukprot:jgi/Chrpa1/11168/Chrysochromulina_OHIO_Genome00005566-RA
MQATKPSATERPGSETSRLVIESTCVVCLQPCEGKKACACSFMHQQCAEAYKQTYGACKVCSVDFTQSIARLNKRHVDAEDEMEMEKRARQRRCAYEEAEKMKNLEWARCVAPSAAHILYRHFRHTGNEAGQTELSFGTIVLSLIHSGEQYIEDLAERLAESKPRPVVDEAIRRLQSLGEALVSPEGIDEACSEEFMRHFQATLAERTNAPFRWNEM